MGSEERYQIHLGSVGDKALLAVKKVDRWEVAEVQPGDKFFSIGTTPVMNARLVNGEWVFKDTSYSKELLPLSFTEQVLEWLKGLEADYGL